MTSTKLFLITFISFLVRTSYSENVLCKCGGEYANDRPVRNCQQGTCMADTDQSMRCVVIQRASQKNYVIGYDCLPWPKEVFPSDCATFDDGSRLCVNDVCSSKTVNGTRVIPIGDCQINDDLAHAAVGVQLNLAGLNFMLDAVRREAKDQVSKLKIPAQTLYQTGFNITVSNIRVETFVPPTLTYDLEPPSAGKVIAKGGDFKVCTSWKAFWVYVPIVSASGELCVWSENQKGVDATVEMLASVTPEGKIHLETGECKFEMPIVLKFTGSYLGTVVNLAHSLIENKIKSEAAKQFCKIVGDAVRATVNAILTELPTTFKVDDRYGLGYTIQSVAMVEYGVKAQVAINATFNGQKRK